MGYTLKAVIATEEVLRALSESVAAAHVVPLGGHLSLLPMTNRLFDEVTEAGGSRPEPKVFWFLPRGYDRRLAECSRRGAVAYVEADYAGGTGGQSAQVWEGGHVVLGPLELAVGEPLPASGGPISLALRRLGIDKAGHFDEFDAVGLGRIRETYGWTGLPDEDEDDAEYGYVAAAPRDAEGPGQRVDTR